MNNYNENGLSLLGKEDIMVINGGGEDDPCGTFGEGFVEGFTGAFRWLKKNVFPLFQ
jgi:hypothetical protein